MTDAGDSECVGHMIGYGRPTLKRMLVGYLDESTDPNSTQVVRPYWIGAVLCDKDSLWQLCQGLDAVVAAAFSAGLTHSPTTELHGYEIYWRTKNWDALSQEQAVWLYSTAAEAIAGSGARLIYRGVDTNRLRFGPHPHSVVIPWLVERLDKLAEHDKTRLILIADDNDQDSTVQRNLWNWRTLSTGGFQQRQITHLLDAVHFTSSAASRGLQAADLFIYLKHKVEDLRSKLRLSQGRPPDQRAVDATEAIWQILEPAVVRQLPDGSQCSGIWTPP